MRDETDEERDTTRASERSGSEPLGADVEPDASADDDSAGTERSPSAGSAVAATADPALEALGELTARRTAAEDVPRASEIVHAVPVYDGATLARAMADRSDRAALIDEWTRVFSVGPGVLAVRGAIADLAMLDDVTALFERIMEEEAGAGSDHFAPAGANTRIWNAHEKLAVRAPELFCRYNATAATALASLAWLGPGYQVTAQVNVVKPGGAAQAPHRDYHLGFMDATTLADYPAHVHSLSAALTLQGAIAHSDMPLESGPTQLLPFSQRWPPGYAASARDDVRAFFGERHVQLPLARGDALFFNPAMLHAAGDNRTADHRRIANLLQISSPLGRAMEVLDRGRICRAIYPALVALSADAALDADAVERVVASAAEGYPFPSNLELGWASGGIRPPSQADVLRAALAAGDAPAALDAALAEHAARRRSH